MTESLAERSVRAAKWNLGGNVAKALLQFAFGILLARLLGPEAFGLVVIALLMVGLGALFADFGFGAALVQARELDRRDVDLAFTIQLAVGLALAILGFVLAGPISGFFAEPDAMPVIRTMSALFVLRGVGQTARALLTRQLDYRRVQAIAIGAYLIAYACIGVPLALSGFGVWSLVAAHLVQAVLENGLNIAAASPRPRLTLRFGQTPMFRFGGRVVAANLASWLVVTLDSVLVGRLFDTALLGIYNRAMNLVAAPAFAVVTGLQGVLFSTCSRANGDEAVIRRAYLASAKGVALFVFPVFLAAATVPEAIILTLYGDVWRAAVPLLPPLALAMCFHALLGLAGPVLMAVDRTQYEVRAQFATAILMIPVLYFAASVSLAALAWGATLVYALRFVFLFKALTMAVSITPAEFFKAIAFPLATGVIAAVAAGVSQLSSFKLGAAGQLAMAIASAAFAVLIALRLFRRQLFSADLGLLAAKAPLPKSVKAWVGH